MRVDDFDFELPQSAIALRPVEPRDASRLLEVRPGQTPDLVDHKIGDLLHILRKGDVLVLNDTKVIPAALIGVRRREDSSATIHVNLHKRLDDSSWLAFAKPAKRLKPGETIDFGSPDRACALGALTARVVEKGQGGEVLLAFDLSGPYLDEAIRARGAMPLPP